MKRITLETVREVLRGALGLGSVTASVITRVTEDPDVPTACIGRDGHLRYSAAFVEEHVRTRKDLFSLVFHELLHPLFGHFIHGPGALENIAADAVINAVISTLYGEESGEGRLFRRLYEPRGLEGLLRPGSRLDNSRFADLYGRLHCSHGAIGGSRDPLSTGELIQTLKILCDKVQIGGIVLLGSHDVSNERGQSDGIAGLPHETKARIAEEIKESARTRASGKRAGFGQDLVGLLMEALRTHLSIRRVLLQQFVTRRKVDRFRELLQARRASVSPVPIRPGKRDLVMLAAGLWPLHFRNQISQTRHRERGLAIYLDVSGSVQEHLPRILGLLRPLRREITTVFQFSNRVVETPFESLLRGRINTTLGTDFDCIARSILERRFDRAVILTDGYASMAKSHQEELRGRGVKTLTVLFGGATKCDALEVLGDAVRLEDACGGGTP